MESNVIPAPITLTFPHFDAALVTDARAALAVARALTVTSDDELTIAAETLAEVKGSLRNVEAARTAASKPVNDALRNWNALFAEPKEALELAEATLKERIATYTTEQARKRQEAERAAEAARRAAQLQAEAEARAKAAEAERVAREAAERQRKADAEARALEAAGEHVKAAEVAAEAYQANESALAQAQATAAEAHIAQQDALSIPVAPVSVPAATKVAGLSTRRTWKARVTDKTALIKAAAEHPALYAGFLDVNEKALNAIAKAQEAQMRVPGVEVYSEAIVASRSR